MPGVDASALGLLPVQPGLSFRLILECKAFASLLSLDYDRGAPGAGASLDRARVLGLRL